MGNRVVSTVGMEKVTTVWLNHNRKQSGAHDNSAPICRRAAFVMGKQGTSTCPSGSSPISDARACAEAAYAYRLSVSGVDMNNRAKLVDYVREREMPSDSNDTKSALAGAQKSFGCFFTEKYGIMNGTMQKVTSVWLNHNKDKSGADRYNAPMCVVLTPTGELP